MFADLETWGIPRYARDDRAFFEERRFVPKARSVKKYIVIPSVARDLKFLTITLLTFL